PRHTAASGDRSGGGWPGATEARGRLGTRRRCSRGGQRPGSRTAAGEDRDRTRRLCRTEGVRQMNARGTSGAVAIEFALIGVAFMSLLLLAMETGYQLLIDSSAGGGARAASRFGSTGTTVAAGITPPPADRNSSIQGLVILNSGNLL